MPNKDVLNITVAAKTIEEGKIMLSSIVSAIVRNVTMVNGCEVETLMCEKGRELLMGSERISEALLSSNRADEFELKKVLYDSSLVKDNMSIAFRCNDTFCGRVKFQCIDVGRVWDSLKTDALLLILAENNVLDGKVIPDVPTIVAILSNTNHDKTIAETELKNYATDRIVNTVTKSAYSCYWYNPYGFDGDSINSIEEASPYGVDDFFWKLMNYAARNGQKYYTDIISQSLKIIKTRRSIFQKSSERRRRELENARKKYVFAVNSIYGIEQLLALTDNNFRQK